MGYTLEGKLLESCTCNTLCPCWAGEDPDGGKCDGVLCWHVTQGEINGLDVSGHTLAVLTHIPGNILEGNWRVVVYVDDATTPEQQEALLGVWTGSLGGPVADLAQLVGEVLEVRRAPVTFEFDDVERGGKGYLVIGDDIETEMAPFIGATGNPLSMHDTAFTTIPGSPAYPGKAPVYKVKVPEHDFDIDLRDHNSVQGYFRFEAA
ncbi:MAG: DUF1326 domain-containing protein [Actinobacteria bacterium]|nr:DUF1326 domain-containing protein [Actinomycetota bacterium]